MIFEIIKRRGTEVGYNGTVPKTDGRLKRHVGSNPTLSAFASLKLDYGEIHSAKTNENKIRSLNQATLYIINKL